MDIVILLLGPAFCGAVAVGALALAWFGGRSTARARTRRQAVEHLLGSLRGRDRESVSTQTFVFADLAGFTALTEARGDQHAARVVGRFCRAVRKLLPDHRAYEVKSLGDGIMLRAAGAADAVRLALRVAEAGDAREDLPAVRVGVHLGPAVERDGDWFGTAVNVAARVCTQARPGEVLVTEAAVDAARGDERICFEFVDERRLRNFSRMVRLHRAAASAASGRGSVAAATGPDREAPELALVGAR